MTSALVRSRGDSPGDGPRWYRFSYHNPPRSADRVLFPHQLRDGDAALFLAPVLEARGYSYGGPILNPPHPEQPSAALVPVDEASLGLRPQDLLVLTTRPPLDDAEEGVKARVLRSHTTLEEKILVAALRPHLSHCSRAQVIVAQQHVRRFSGVASRWNLDFRLYRGGRVPGAQSGGPAPRKNLGARLQGYMSVGSKRWHWLAPEQSVSIAFVIYEEHAWPGGPGVLAVFGMGGIETLVWARALRMRFPHLIATCPFVMVEMLETEMPDQPLTLDFGDTWEFHLLTEARPDAATSGAP